VARSATDGCIDLSRYVAESPEIVLRGGRPPGVFPSKSHRWIAEACGVSNRFVGEVRSEVCTVHTSRIGQDGKTYPAPPKPSAARAPAQTDDADDAEENGEEESDAPIKEPPFDMLIARG
jgi:hypothetical protein